MFNRVDWICSIRSATIDNMAFRMSPAYFLRNAPDT
jgi:hypothetical protein